LTHTQYNRTKDVCFRLTATLLHICISQYRFAQSNGLRLPAYNIILSDVDNTRVRYQNTAYKMYLTEQTMSNIKSYLCT
jgi:hypothetical protein